MNPEIEELRKFAKATVTRSRLEKLRAALSNATALSERLEVKAGDEETAEEFESAQTELESALDELDAGCDELDAAEDKDEREDAQEQISSALENVLDYFDEIMPVAIIGNPAGDAQLIADCQQRLPEFLPLPEEQRRAYLTKWLESASETEKKKKLECLLRLIDQRSSG